MYLCMCVYIYIYIYTHTHVKLISIVGLDGDPDEARGGRHVGRLAEAGGPHARYTK